MTSPGDILRVDLSTGRSWREPLAPALAAESIGGRGLGMRLLADAARLEWSAPELPLIFTAGPLTATPVPCAAQVMAVSRSPLTGTPFATPLYGEFALAFRRAGLLALVISGRAPRPVWLRLEVGSCAIEPADGLVGLDPLTVAGCLAGAGEVAAIGLAGELGVPLAGISSGGAAVGRGGLGALMGTKRLKAIAVQGSLEPRLMDRAGLQRAVADLHRLFQASPLLYGEHGLHRHGSACLVDLVNLRRMTPTANFRRTWFAGASGYNAAALQRQFTLGASDCSACPITCHRVTAAGSTVPDFESLAAFGALLENSNPQAILAATTRCDRYGMDGVSAASTLAAYAELAGRELLPGEVCDLLAAMAKGEGEGEALQRGAAAYCRERRYPELAMTVKGLEIPPFDPRGAYGLALGYAVCTRGADHWAANTLYSEILRKPVATERFSFSGKARLVKLAEDTAAAAESLAICHYPLVATGMEEWGAALAAVSGQPWSARELLAAGARTVSLERLLNRENGFTADDDDLPARFFSAPGSSGDGIQVPPLDRQRFLEERQRYYRLRDGETSCATR